MKTIRLSVSDIDEYQKDLMAYKKKLIQASQNIVKRASEEGLKDNYKSTELLPVQYSNGVATGGIQTTEEKHTYQEFGTGIVGSQNPHVAEYLAEQGWQYDVNGHGEKGWVYPKEDGTFGWTKGVPAQKKFYEATKRMEERMKEIAVDELQKAMK